MATRLKNLKLSELSLVDSPANKGARVSLFKRDTTEGNTMTDAEKIADLTKKLDDAKKAAEIAKGDEVIKVGDTEIRKSAVGEATFAMFKAQQAEITKAKDEAELVTLQKRAETEFGALPGEPLAKAKVLKAVASLPEAERTELEKMLKAGQASMQKFFKSSGHDGNSNGADGPEAELNALIAKTATDEKISIIKATDKVMETEQGKKLYSEATRAARRAA